MVQAIDNQTLKRWSRWSMYSAMQVQLEGKESLFLKWALSCKCLKWCRLELSYTDTYHIFVTLSQMDQLWEILNVRKCNGRRMKKCSFGCWALMIIIGLQNLVWEIWTHGQQLHRTCRAMWILFFESSNNFRIVQNLIVLSNGSMLKCQGIGINM